MDNNNRIEQYINYFDYYEINKKKFKTDIKKDS